MELNKKLWRNFEMEKDGIKLRNIIDKTNVKILSFCSHKSRSCRQIASHIDKSEPAIRHRIKKLKYNGLLREDDGHGTSISTKYIVPDKIEDEYNFGNLVIELSKIYGDECVD